MILDICPLRKYIYDTEPRKRYTGHHGGIRKRLSSATLLRLRRWVMGSLVKLIPPSAGLVAVNEKLNVPNENTLAKAPLADTYLDTSW